MGSFSCGKDADPGSISNTARIAGSRRPVAPFEDWFELGQGFERDTFADCIIYGHDVSVQLNWNNFLCEYTRV